MRSLSIIFIAAMALLPSLSASAQNDKEKLPPANPSASAEFSVTTTRQQPDPGAFTATIGAVPNRAFTAGGFEPMIFRTKIEAAFDSRDELPLEFTPWDYYGAFKDGFYDGARVRVYRPRGGKFVKVRDSRVPDGGYTSSWWHPFFVGGKHGDKIVKPEATSVQLELGGNWRKNTTYWFAVKAVSNDNVESEPSNGAKIQYEDTQKGANASQDSIISFKQPQDLVRIQFDPPANRPAPPKNLKAEIDDQGVITLTWNATNASDLAGYRIYFSDVDPAQHKGFHFRLGSGEMIKKGDIIFLTHKHYTDSRKEMIRNSRFDLKGLSARHNASPLGFPTIRDYPDETPGMSWELVEHDIARLPEAFTNPGETCMKVDLQGDATANVYCFGYGGMESTWWRPIIPGLEYTIEVWLKSDARGKAEFRVSGFHEDLGGITFDMGPTWRKHTATFQTDKEYNGNQLGNASLQISGEGTHYIDNIFIYPTKDGFLEPSEMMIQRTRESGLEAVRYHNHIKSGRSYDMAMLTNSNGVVGTRGNSQPNNRNTLEALLRFTKAAESNPWFQIEMHMSEEEWLGFMEYIAAPYDPEKDTPQSKPWAYKRYRQGQKRPWADEFDKIYFEISNETWNWMFAPWVFYPGTSDEETGESYDRGALYGMLNEYVLSVLKTSPYWTPEFAEKFRSVLGGWKTADNGYSLEAVTHSPNADYLTVAAYNGGWDAGEDAAKPTPEGIYRVMMFWMRDKARSAASMSLMRQLKAEGRIGGQTRFGSYEAGPGYALPGTLKGGAEELQDQVGKSLANGMATLDAFLGRANDGWAVQNFFTMSFGRRNWTSHAAPVKGGHPYPSWAALSMYNNHGTGDFLLVETKSVPTNHFSYTNKGKTQVFESVPQVGVYATADDDRVNVFVLSRKLPGIMDDNGDGRVNEQDDGYSAVTLDLPFSKAAAVDCYKMTGDPYAHNLDEEKIKFVKVENIPFSQSFKMTRATTGEDKDGIPPASVFLYAFKGTDVAGLNERPTASFSVPETIIAGSAFNATSAAVDPDGDQLDISWTVDGELDLKGEKPSITFAEAGDHEITMRVTDGRGGQDTTTMAVKAYQQWKDHLLDLRYLAPVWDSHRPALKITDEGRLQFETPGRLEQHGSFGVATLAGQQQGDASLRVHIQSHTSVNDNENSRSGIVMLSSLDMGAPRVVLAIKMSGQAELLTRKANVRASVPMEAPCWLRLDKQGKNFTAYVSKDGSDGSWKEIGSVEENIPDTYHLGLFGSYGAWQGPQTAVIDEIQVR